MLMTPPEKEVELLPPLVQIIPSGTSTPSVIQSGAGSDGQGQADLSEPALGTSLPVPGDISIGKERFPFTLPAPMSSVVLLCVPVQPGPSHSDMVSCMVNPQRLS